MTKFVRVYVITVSQAEFKHAPVDMFARFGRDLAIYRAAHIEDSGACGGTLIDLSKRDNTLRPLPLSMICNEVGLDIIAAKRAQGFDHDTPRKSANVIHDIKDAESSQTPVFSGLQTHCIKACAVYNAENDKLISVHATSDLFGLKSANDAEINELDIKKDLPKDNPQTEIDTIKRAVQDKIDAEINAHTAAVKGADVMGAFKEWLCNIALRAADPSQKVGKLNDEFSELILVLRGALYDGMVGAKCSCTGGFPSYGVHSYTDDDISAMTVKMLNGTL